MNKRIVEHPCNTKASLIPFTRGHVIYFLLQGDYVAYVGQTVHLSSRVSQHVIDGKQFDYVSYISVDGKEALYVEALNIRHHNPDLNNYIPSDSDIRAMRAKM